MPEMPDWRAEPGTDHYEAIRHDVIVSAEKLINEVGIAGLRMGPLAERIGCTRQNLYRYFPSKEEVVHAVLLYRTQRLAKRLRRSIKKEMPLEERLVVGIVEGVELASRDHSLRSYYSGASAGKMLGFVANSKGLLQSVSDGLAPLLDEAEGWLREDLSRDDVAEWLCRIFINELIWTTTVRRTRKERESLLRKMLIPSLMRPEAKKR